jgi:rare lipoprotein A
MIRYLRKSGIRYAVALGIGLSAAAPAQTVGSSAASVLPVIQDLNETSGESIRAIVDGHDETAPTVEAPIYEAVGQGHASYYGAELAGHRTASGERFDPGALTAAHRTLPIGSRVRVTNLANGMSVVVRVNDRGPGARSRILDLSRAAAKEISMIRSGTAQVKLELVHYS